MSENIVMHCQKGNSDKVYIVSVSESTTSSLYKVVGKWGRRGKRFSEQDKGSYPTVGRARQAAMELVRTKRSKGYVNIEELGYNGSLTMSSPDIAKYLEGALENIQSKPEPKPKVKKEKVEIEEMPKLEGEEVCVAECINNAGLQDWFDLGISYIITRIEKIDGQMMATAIDNEGKEKDCYRNRFGLLSVE